VPGFDLTQPFSVRLDDRRISAELPPAKILAIDPRDVEVLAFENGLWNKISPTELESELRSLPDLARRKALETGLTKEALDIFSKRLRDQLGPRLRLRRARAVAAGLSAAQRLRDGATLV
jgi:hypothetical protein